MRARIKNEQDAVCGNMASRRFAGSPIDHFDRRNLAKDPRVSRDQRCDRADFASRDRQRSD